MVDKIIRLVEERTLSTYSFEFEDVIQNVVDYVEAVYQRYGPTKQDWGELKDGGYIKYMMKVENRYKPFKVPMKYNSFDFTVPVGLTKDVDIMEELHIRVTLKNIVIETPFEKNEYQWIRKSLSQGAGATNNLPHNDITDGVVKYGVVDMTLYILNGEFLLNGAKIVLRHEFNHLFEQYERIIQTNDNFTSFHHQRIRQNRLIPKENVLDDFDVAYNDLVYMLFDNGELSAFATQIYSELENMNSVRTNFQKDLENSGIYLRYQKCLYQQKLLSCLKDENRWERYRAFFNWRKKDMGNYFRKYFLKELDRLLNKYIMRIGAAATLYYDKQEAKKSQELINNLKTSKSLNLKKNNEYSKENES